MPIRLRFAVQGLRNNRSFQLVAIDKRRRRDGKPAELLGVYQPHLNPGENKKVVEWSVDRIRYWLDVGAVPSKSVVRLLELGNILKPGHSWERRIPETKASAEPSSQESSPSSTGTKQAAS
ncbi:hypothetical protein M378DRAFT_183489 [Amanita muscaria Koide BX008]|uniref:Ribosomal protein S16 n=1 Tax=Amanita muscaria (strain Koide BX008) TaxID=946122 RepID=A0A0C2T4U4_AMAMK|nr:hypothetical protein M378DRAFT_183489 [Amanita muscaria Koide BX008]